MGCLVLFWLSWTLSYKFSLSGLKARPLSPALNIRGKCDPLTVQGFGGLPSFGGVSQIPFVHIRDFLAAENGIASHLR